MIFRIFLSFIFLTLLMQVSWQTSAQANMSEADLLFDDKMYELALKDYLRLLRKDKKNLHLYKQIGFCYVRIDDDKTQAIPYLEYADSLDTEDPLIKLELGKAYFHDYNFDKAIATFKKYLKAPGSESEEEDLIEADRYIEMSMNAIELMKTPLDVTFINMQEEINTKRSDYCPFISEDGRFLVFSNNNRYISDFKTLVQNIYYSKPFLGSWNKCKSIGPKVNTDEDESVVWMSKDGETILICVNSALAENDIMVSRMVKNRFQAPESLGKVINTSHVEQGACFTQSQDTIIFSSDRPNGQGGMDLYYSIKLPDGEWSIPTNLGKLINTEFDENFPNLSADGKTLYFASSGHNSMGGYDLFRSVLDQTSGSWNPPQNYGYPINNTYDNYTISHSSDERYAYISSFRSDGIGYLDIYKIIFNNIEAEQVIFTGIIAAGDSLHPVDIETIDPQLSIKVFRDGSSDPYGIYSYSKQSKKYTIALPPGNFALKITGDSYEPYSANFEIFERFYDVKIFTHNIYLKKKSTP